MADLYVADIIKRALNERYGFNFTLLQYGIYAAARRAEMARARDYREYLGQLQAGGEVDKGVSSVLARYQTWRTDYATATAAATTPTIAAKALRSVERSEGMNFGTFAEGILKVLSSLLNKPIASLWSWLPWTALLIPLLTTLYFLVQGTTFLPGFETVQRRVWYEDLDQRYGVSSIIAAVLRGFLAFLGWIIAGPFVIFAAVFRSVRKSAGWKELCDLWRRGKRPIGREAHRAYNDIRYNVVTDTLWLQYWRVTTFFRRNGLRVFISGIAIWAGWRFLAHGGQSKEIVQFDSMQEMAAWFGVPQDPFLPKKECGSNSHYRPELWEPGESRNRVFGFKSDGEVGDGFSVAQAEVAIDGDGALLVEIEDEELEMVQSEPGAEKVRSRGPEEPVVVWKQPLGEGRVAFCRKCRQKHCCEAVNAEPAPATLSLQL